MEKGSHKSNGLLKPFSGLTPPFYIETAITITGRNVGYPMAGLIFADGATYGVGNQIGVGFVGNMNTIGAYRWTNFNTRASYTELAMLPYGQNGIIYIRFVYESANTYRVLHSLDGVVWIDMNGTLSFTITPTHFGLLETSHDNSNYPFSASYKYFRVREGLPING